MKNPNVNEYPFVERRSGKDRRARQTSPFSKRSLFGSRQHYRRKEDAEKNYFVDLYSPIFMVILVVTLILSVTDAFLTMKLVSEHFQEINPIMDYFIRLGPFPFMLVKCALTSFGLVILLILKNYYLLGGRVKAAVLLVIFPLLYLILIIYEVAMVVKHGQ